MPGLVVEIVMAHLQRRLADAPKRATNLSISESLLAEAKALEVNISRAAEYGLASAIAKRRADLWLQENRAALESSNAFVERQGLPLSRYRNF